MPHANPNGSFEAASRHLFRHINDVDALRLNPLVSPFFDRAKDADEEKTALLELHARIMMIARDAGHKDMSRGAKPGPKRREGIVAAICSGERWQTTAGQLGLSARHYFRERRAICDRVSRILLEESSKHYIRFEVNDPLRFLLARSAVLIDQGFPCKAANVLQDACMALPEGTAKAAVNSALARALLSLGLPNRASALLEARSVKTEAIQREDSTNGWLRDHIMFTRALIAIENGDHSTVGPALEAIAKRSIADQRVDEESVGAILACGEWYCLNGAFSKARTMLNQARHLNRRLPHPAPTLKINIILLDAHCADDPDAEFSLQYEWLSEAKALSISTGSAEGTLNAISGLLGYHVATGNDDEIYVLSEEGLQIAQATESVLLLQLISTQIVQGVLRTPCWRAVAPLLFEIERFMEPASFRWAMLKRLQGDFLRRVGQYEAASSALRDALTFMQSAGDKSLEAIILRDLALAQHQSGATTESIDSMREAIRLAEGHSSALALCVTYEAAAQLLKERRIMRLAQQARAALATRTNQARNFRETHHSRLPPFDRSRLSPGVLPRLALADEKRPFGLIARRGGLGNL